MATIAVTGSEGFIASHLVELLVHEGYRVRAMVQYNSFASWGWLETLPAEVLAAIDVLLGDVRDPRSVDELVEGADAVCHLAALIAIPYSYQAPASYVATNVTGTLTVPIDERHPLQAQSPYAASKIAADKLAESYHLSFDLPVTTLRPFNTFGPRQSARAVIPTTVSQIAAGRDRIALGALDPTRDFTFVLDTAAAFLALLESDDDVVGRTYNAGTGHEIAIGDLVRLIAEVMGRDVEVVADADRLRPASSEVRRLVCDSSALRAATSWKPQHTLREGLRATAEWFCEPRNLAHYKTDRYVV